ncbi:lamin tail domain-containing protein [Akkermansiaceae bacterium]|nr:lamin tail domain-containing protein [Akkermansiaceae bacterium]MDB4537323.1 lamin tail domain-containing protein [Akkermansiaceae bacterium]
MKFGKSLLCVVLGSAPLCGQVVINEIHYNSEPNTSADEFVELVNIGAEEVDVSGWFFQQGISYTIPANTTIGSGQFLVIGQDPTTLLSKYSVTALGPYSGALSGDGETVELRRADGQTVDEVSYGTAFPWPVGPNGTGSSMELIHPALDNDLGASWRSSQQSGLAEAVLIPEAADGWRWRKGDSEASSPIDAWTGEGFVEDETWTTQAMPIGYGGVGTQVFSPAITGMQNNFTSVFFRKSFTIAPGEVPQKLLLRFLLDDGMVVFLNGSEVYRSANLPGGNLTIADAASSNGDENNWQDEEILGTAALLHEGENTIAIHCFNAGAGSSDFGLNVELVRPGPDLEEPPIPSPGAQNTVYSATAPPAIRQVNHSPEQPMAGETTVITAKVTDPDGVGSVVVEVQAVAPGSYVPAFLAKATSVLRAQPNAPRDPNPAYEQNWVSYQMVDNGSGMDEVAGDGIYTAAIAGEVSRTLVRYRITVSDLLGAEQRVPYADDPRLNFAYFHYDGVPEYAATTRSVLGVPHTYSAETMSALPSYHVLTTAADFDQAVAYNSGDQIDRNLYDARSAYNWNCSFVYEGKVYDHVQYRLRQRNARYAGAGKRSFKFRFNRGNYPTFRNRDGEKYPEPWKFLATHKMIGSRGHYTWGMDQATNHLMWNLTGTPAPHTHWFQMRVVRGAEESPVGANGQYLGDYYGTLLALEEYDKRFLDTHNLEKGNLYKLISGRTDGLSVQRYQAAGAVDDGTDFTTIINQLRPARDDAWLDEHVNFDSWNHYHAVIDMIRHYDVQPNTGEHLKNRAYYFEPSATNPLGRLNVLPWDSDTSWGPNWNGGIDFPMNVVFGEFNNNPREPYSIEYLNVVREMRDLIWTEEQIDLMIDPLASIVAPQVSADRDRWIAAIGGSQTSPPLETVTDDMKKFAFIGGSWIGGTNNLMPAISDDAGISGQQGRDAYLDALTADPLLPATPTISYSGAAGFPQDDLSFTSSAFSDPQGAGSFGAMEWRVSEVNQVGGGVRDIMPGGRTWSFLDDGSDQGTAWKEVGFDVGGWQMGAAPLGFGGVTELTFQTPIERGAITSYFRTTVNVDEVDSLETFTFRILADDAAVIWVNGVEAVRDDFASGVVINFDTPAPGRGSETEYADYVVDAGLFVEGENLIAVELHNESVSSSDMGFEMTVTATEKLILDGGPPLFEWTADWESGELTSFAPQIDLPSVTRVGRPYRARVRHRDNTNRWSNWSEPLEFTVGSPTIQPWLDGLVVSKIMYHPLPPTIAELAAMPAVEEGDFEWIEIMNVGTVSLDLSEVRFTKGVEFDFVTGSKSSIAPGERLLIVANIAAFNLRHGFAVTPDYVVGEFSKSLSNDGERLKLSFGAGTTIRDFEYNDAFPWAAPADGLGAALVLISPESLASGNEAAHWRTSVADQGGPGADDALAFVGDPNGDENGNGLTNFLEYAVLSDLEISVEDSVIFLSYTRKVNADDALIEVQGSSALFEWTSEAVTLESEVYGPNQESRVTYRVTDPVAEAKGFFRLRVIER